MSEKFHGQILHFYNLIVCFVSFIMMKSCFMERVQLKKNLKLKYILHKNICSLLTVSWIFLVQKQVHFSGLSGSNRTYETSL